jgi:hypothetical protein
VQRIILMSLFLSSVCFSAETRLKFFPNAKHPENLYAVISWDLKKRSCNLEDPHHQKSFPLKLEACAGLDRYLSENQEAFKSLIKEGYTLQQRRFREGPHVPLAQIEVNGMKFAILKTSAEVCDATMTKCRPSSTRVVDQLGFKVLDIVNENFK